MIMFDLNLPNVDYAIDPVNNLPSNNFQPLAFNTCLANLTSFNQTQVIETWQGKIHPARDIAIENGQIRLTTQPTAGNNIRRNSIQFRSAIFS